MVKLVQNFRSHHDILSFPNKIFYGGGLRSCGTPQTINAYLGCSLLPNKSFPVMFYGVSGKDDREGLSPSFFNTDEASLVKTMVISLLTDRQLRCCKLSYESSVGEIKAKISNSGFSGH